MSPAPCEAHEYYKPSQPQQARHDQVKRVTCALNAISSTYVLSHFAFLGKLRDEGSVVSCLTLGSSGDRRAVQNVSEHKPAVSQAEACLPPLEPANRHKHKRSSANTMSLW